MVSIDPIYLSFAFSKKSQDRQIENYTTILYMLNFLYINLISKCDTPRPWGLYFQDSATPQMEGLVELHDNIMFYLVIILFGVSWILISIVRNYVNSKSPISHKYLNHGKNVPTRMYFKFNSSSLSYKVPTIRYSSTSPEDRENTLAKLYKYFYN